MNYWLVKSEPDAWSWDQRVKSGKKGEALDAVNKSIAAGGMQMSDGQNASELLKKQIEASN